jgi:WD40 repeat protein
MRVWDLERQRIVATLGGFESNAINVVFSEEQRLVASGEKNGTVRLWETGTWRSLGSFRAHRGGVWCMAVSPDGNRLATGSGDRTIRVTDLATRHAVATLGGYTTQVTRLQFSSDGKTLISTSGDGVRFWNTATWTEALTLTDPKLNDQGLAFSPDGHLLATPRTDGTLRLYRAASFAETDRLQVTASSAGAHLQRQPRGWPASGIAGWRRERSSRGRTAGRLP